MLSLTPPSPETPAAPIHLLYFTNKNGNSSEREANHLNLHVSFEITCHGYTRNFFPLEERDREWRREGVRRNNKLSEVYSVQFHMSNFRVRGQIAQNVFVHTSISCTYTQIPRSAACAYSNKNWICLCACLCIRVNVPPAPRNRFVAFDYLFLFDLSVVQYFPLYNEKPQTWLIMHACPAGCWHTALISKQTEWEEPIKCRATLVLLGWRKLRDLTAVLLTH